MRTSDYFILAALAALPFAYGFFRKWILAPIRIYRTQTIAMRPEFEYATPELNEIRHGLMCAMGIESTLLAISTPPAVSI